MIDYPCLPQSLADYSAAATVNTDFNANCRQAAAAQVGLSFEFGHGVDLTTNKAYYTLTSANVAANELLVNWYEIDLVAATPWVVSTALSLPVFSYVLDMSGYDFSDANDYTRRFFGSDWLLEAFASTSSPYSSMAVWVNVRTGAHSLMTNFGGHIGAVYYDKVSNKFYIYALINEEDGGPKESSVYQVTPGSEYDAAYWRQPGNAIVTGGNASTSGPDGSGDPRLRGAPTGEMMVTSVGYTGLFSMNGTVLSETDSHDAYRLISCLYRDVSKLLGYRLGAWREIPDDLDSAASEGDLVVVASGVEDVLDLSLGSPQHHPLLGIQVFNQSDSWGTDPLSAFWEPDYSLTMPNVFNVSDQPAVTVLNMSLFEPPAEEPIPPEGDIGDRAHTLSQFSTVYYAGVDTAPLASRYSVAVNGRPAPLDLDFDTTVFREICMPSGIAPLVEETDIIRGGADVPCRSCLRG